MYATIIDRKLQSHKGVPSLERMQEVVGGYIDTALRGPSPTRKGFSVDVYCNDEGLLIGLPIDHIRKTDNSPVAGNMVIVVSNERTGNTVEGTNEELASILPFIGRLPVTFTPADFGF